MATSASTLPRPRSPNGTYSMTFLPARNSSLPECLSSSCPSTPPSSSSTKSSATSSSIPRSAPSSPCTSAFTTKVLRAPTPALPTPPILPMPLILSTLPIFLTPPLPSMPKSASTPIPTLSSASFFPASRPSKPCQTVILTERASYGRTTVKPISDSNGSKSLSRCSSECRSRIQNVAIQQSMVLRTV